jgi:hypothetical protein
MKPFPVFVAVACVVAACASMHVVSDFDRNANFSSYHTFAMLSRQHRSTRNPLVARRAREAIEAELTRKGYSLVSDPAKAADFIVDYTIGSRERTDIEAYPEPYRGPWVWGSPYFGDYVDVRQYREGTLAIDIFEARTHQPVWHGWAKKDLSQADIERPEGPIQAAVAAVLAMFPPK